MTDRIVKKIQTELLFLQYSIGYTCPIYYIKQSVQSICNHIELLDIQSTEYCVYKQYLFTFIFYIRDGYFNGKKRPRESYEILLTAYLFYPKEILNLIEQYVYYGSFKDINNLLLFTHDHPCYHSITSTCIDIYIKYLLIDYNKVFYFMEHDGSSLYISKCAEYIPKENKYIDKETGATHEIANRLFPRLYKNKKGAALRLFRNMYQTIRKITQISSTNKLNNSCEIYKKNMYEPLEFIFLHSGCVQTRSFADTFIQYNSKIKVCTQPLTKKYLQSYRAYLLDYYNKIIVNTYTPLEDCYVAKKYDDENVEYIKNYYRTNIHYFWPICKRFVSHDYYNRIEKIIQLQ